MVTIYINGRIESIIHCMSVIADRRLGSKKAMKIHFVKKSEKIL